MLTCERLNLTTSVRKERLRAWSLLLLAATVRSFAHMPLGISDRNNSYKMWKVRTSQCARTTSTDLWTCKLIKGGQSIFTKCWSQECLFVRHINRENPPTTFYQSYMRKACKMGLNSTANSCVFGHINRENLSRNFSVNLGGGELPKCVWISQQTVSFFGRTNRGIAPSTFCKSRRQRTSKMRLNFRAHSTVFGRTNRGIAPTTFSVKLAGRELPECVWISLQTAPFLDAQIVELLPELFLQNLQAENFLNAFEFNGKQLHFWTHKSWNRTYNFFSKTRRQRTSKMRLNFTANSFTFGRANRGIALQLFL